ncbi:LptF/LptG family permease [Candidatus Palauibacter soopunensis]|uniref:LptF/LptG family permease n=1 Tax=Candidatus Palauibacter soopunensis TaxID=3056739 RepID=UPI0023A22B7A|nr:LptF/LptG family permease [Candidatus Palauibacter soopunensis]MDE2877964.1 LptF/LptG family permease [Candidatus Palauibacter soopunensis]
MRTLTRYILRRHAGPFIFAVIGTTVLLLLDQVSKRFERLIGKDLEWTVIAEVFVYSIPFILAQTLPMAVLIAVLYVFSRMEGDFEITAVKASGIPLSRVMTPLLVCAVILAGGMTWFNNTVLPQSNHHLQVLLRGIGRKTPTFNLREHTINEVLPSYVYVHPGMIDREESVVHDVAIYDERNGQESRSIYATRGKMGFSEEGEDLYFDLEDGVVQVRLNERPHAFRRIAFERMLLKIPDVANGLERDTAAIRGDREMNIADMRVEAGRGAQMANAARSESLVYAQAITGMLLDFEQPLADAPLPGAGPADGARTRESDTRDRRDDISDLERDASYRQVTVARREDDPPATPEAPAQREIEPGPAQEAAAPDSTTQVAESAARRFYTAFDAANQFQSYAEREVTGLRRINQYWVEIHKKGTIPAACIVFVLLGAPIAVRFPRGGVALVVGVSLGIFGAYYVSLIGGERLADRLWISPLWAMWAPNVIFGAAGLVALARSTRVLR